MTQVSFRHGTAYAYIEFKCRCDLCKAANTARARKLRTEKLYGRHVAKFVDAQPAREHVQKLIDQGWGYRTIAKQANMSYKRIHQLIHGRSPSEMSNRPAQLQKILRTNAEAILNVRFDVATSPDGVHVSSRATIRRIEALAAAGWSLTWQAKQIGSSPANFTGIMKRNKCAAKTAKAVAELFEKYAYQKRVGKTRQERYSVTRSLNQAKNKGWVTAMAWDDIEHDDKPAVVTKLQTVDTVIVETLLSGRQVKLPHGSKTMYAKAMLRYGVTQTFVAQTLNMSGGTISAIKGEMEKEHV